MPRRENRKTPKIISGLLYTDDAYTGTVVGSPAWFEWLATASTFYYESRRGTFTAHRERRQRGGLYWTAYRRHGGVLRRAYLGQAKALTVAHLDNAAVLLAPASTWWVDKGEQG
jgi:LuxR family transcriptional regulator, maltose regulon positive regulatory protein